MSKANCSESGAESANLGDLLVRDSGLTDAELKIFEGMEEVHAEMEKKITAPKCHFTPMSFEDSDYESWWVCHHCGHTKEIGFMAMPH